MRLDMIELQCPKCGAPLDLSGSRIPDHFLDEQRKGAMVTYNGKRDIMALTFRKLCRMSGARIDSLVGPGSGRVLP